MLAGKLRKRVSIQSKSTSQDSFGQQVISWTNVLTSVSAEVLPLFAYEKTGQGQASAVHQVTVRYNAALANPVAVAAMRVVYGSRILDVTGSINMDERNREMVLTCTEGLTLG